MADLAKRNETPIVTTEIYELDENILKKLSSKNNKQALSENTIKAYAAVIRDFNRFLMIDGLTINPESVKAYFDSISHLSPATKNHRKYALLKVIKAQLGENHILLNLAIEKAFESIPSYRIDNTVPDDKYLTEAQVLALMNAATKKTKLIIHFLFKTGCRVSEMIEIRLKDCDIIGNLVKIRITGKGRRVRKIMIPLSLYDETRAEYAGTTWLFESRSGHPLNRNNIGHQIKDAGRRIGLANVHPHIFRHTRATDLIINKGQSTKATSLYLGHSSTAITLDMYVKDRVNVNELFSRDMI